MWYSKDGERYARLIGPMPEGEQEWYDSVGLGLHILGKRWYDDLTKEEDAFVLAFADAISPRPEREKDPE